MTQPTPPAAHPALDQEAATDNPNTVQEQPFLTGQRHPLIIAFLYLLTFGIYSSFWLVARAREFNKLQSKTKYRPWLWFFPPLIILAQLIALPKFFDQLKTLSVERKVTLPAIHGVLWMVILFVVAALAAVELKYELPFWVTLLYMLAGASAFAWSQHWFNRLKQQCTEFKFKHPPLWFNNYEWASVIIGLCIWIVAIIVFIPDMYPTGDKLKDNSQYALPEHEFLLPIKGEHWRADVPGGEDSIAIIDGKLLSMHFELYHYGFSQSLDSISYWRLEAMQEYLDGSSTCTHERFFDGDTANVIAFGVCTGTDTLDPAVHTVTVINTPNKGIYELYGQFSAPKLSFQQYKQNVLDMAKGFRAQ